MKGITVFWGCSVDEHLGLGKASGRTVKASHSLVRKALGHGSQIRGDLRGTVKLPQQMGHSRILSLSTMEEEKPSPILDISPRDKSNT